MCWKKYLKSFQFNLPAGECRRIVKMQKFHFLQSDISPETVKRWRVRPRHYRIKGSKLDTAGCKLKDREIQNNINSNQMLNFTKQQIKLCK